MRGVKAAGVCAGAAVVLGVVIYFAASGSFPAEAALPTGRPKGLAPERAKAFAGSDACATCHAEEARSFAKTHHAGTLRRVEPNDAELLPYFRRSDFLLDPYLHTRIAPGVEAGQPGFRITRAGDTRFYPAVWVLGASKRGYTFLCRDPEGFLTEGKISYYPAAQEWRFTPGQPSEAPVPHPIGRRGVEESCMPCHATAVAAVEGRLDEPASHLQLGCESCHGAAAAHAKAKTHDLRAPLRLARFRDAPAADQVAVCGGCHRPPGDASSLKPGNPALARFQGAALGMSACYQRSGGKLTCTSCHDPHANAARTPEQYEAVCRSCHAGTKSTASSGCRLGKTSGCISCHMQEQDVGMPGKQLFRLHWIH